MKKVKISFILNIVTVILVILMVTLMLLRVHFMPAKDLLILSSRFENFKFYTIDSNILVLLSSLLLSIYEYRLLKGKIKEIPNRVYIFKMVSIAAISVTFIITLCFFLIYYYIFAEFYYFFHFY